MKKKLTPASIISQKKWGSLTTKNKNTLRKMLPDKDKDGVPNKYDCRPKNRSKQESFKPSDDTYLKSKPMIKLNKKLGEGAYGAFYSIEGNDKLGVKVPFCSLDNPRYGVSSCKECESRKDIIDEGRKCHAEGFNNKPMLSATRVVPISRHGRKCVGLVRPLVGVVNDSNAYLLTDQQIKQIHKKVLELSKRGIVLFDGIQCGFTGSGRVLQFDLGNVDHMDEEAAFEINRETWINLLAIARGLQPDLCAIGDFEISEALAKCRKEGNMRKYSELLKLYDLLKEYGDVIL